MHVNFSFYPNTFRAIHKPKQIKVHICIIIEDEQFLIADNCNTISEQ